MAALRAVPRGDLISRYREVLGRLWLLNLPPGDLRPAERHHERDLEDARELLREQARLCDEIAPDFAAAIGRDAAREWSRRMRACAWCGTAGVYHDPETGAEERLA